MISSIISFILPIYMSLAYDPLLNELGRLYPSQALVDDLNSIAIDELSQTLYATNTASGTIDIISYSSCLPSSPSSCELDVLRSLDIAYQASDLFDLDYISSITNTESYIISTLIPFKYAKLTGWLVLINQKTQSIDTFIELKFCYSPKHIIATKDNTKLIIACEGLADGDVADPVGSVSVIDISSPDPTQWKVYNVGFTDYDECDEEMTGDDDDAGHHEMKPLPEGIYLPKPAELFSVNAEPEFLSIDTNDRYVFISLQENDGVAVLDLHSLEIIEIFSLGAHDFGFSGLDASDRDGGINIAKYNNVFGLRQADNIAYYTSPNGNNYLLTANEGNAKYYDTVRVDQIELSPAAFPPVLQLQDDDKLGRLQVLNGGTDYGQNREGQYEQLYAFGSRDFSIWQIEGGLTEDCPCDYPYALRHKFSSLDDFEQITAAELGVDGFNSDFDAPSGDMRSDGKGPEPESIIVGQCSNGDVYAFIGLERVGGIMVYDITDIDKGDVFYVEYLNTRNFTVSYDGNTRPPQNAGDVEPETMIFIADNDDSEQALLFVGYKTSASLGVYSFDCGCHRRYKKDNKPQVDPISTGPANECIQQSTCLNVDIRPILNIGDSINNAIILSDEIEANTEMYVVCMTFDVNNPYCTKDDAYFEYAANIADDDDVSNDLLGKWYEGTQICQVHACDDYARFAILDGDGCKNTATLTTMIDNIDDIQCLAMDANDACQWMVPTPLCNNIYHDIATTPTPTSETDTASTCDTQGPCLNLDITAFGTESYKICMSWDGANVGCAKKTDVPFVSVASSTSTQNQWKSGTYYKTCEIVACGQIATFGVKDESCLNSVDFSGEVDSVSGVACQGINGGFGIDESCQWTVPAPQCALTDYGVITGDDGIGVENNKEKPNDLNLDTITNAGGHFYESIMFYILLSVFVLTMICIILCIWKCSKNNEDFEHSQTLNEDEMSHFAD